MQRWVRKARREHLRGCTVVALLPARTNTGWWHDCIQDIAEVRFIRSQVTFKGFERGLWMPMCVVVWAGKRPNTPAPYRKRSPLDALGWAGSEDFPGSDL